MSAILSRFHCFNVYFPSVPQFWAAYVSCDTQFHDAVRATLEQIDVIHRFIEANPRDFKFVTTADGMNFMISCTVKSVCNDHLFNKINYLWFIQ